MSKANAATVAQIAQATAATRAMVETWNDEDVSTLNKRQTLTYVKNTEYLLRYIAQLADELARVKQRRESKN
jgi:hypothetical protein